MQEPWVQYLGGEDPLEKEMATHPSILAWRIPWTEEPSKLQSTGLQRVGHDWVTDNTCTNKQIAPSVFPCAVQWAFSSLAGPVLCCSWPAPSDACRLPYHRSPVSPRDTVSLSHPSTHPSAYPTIHFTPTVMADPLPGGEAPAVIFNQEWGRFCFSRMPLEIFWWPQLKICC